MKKIFVILLCLVSVSLQAQRQYFYNNGTQVYYEEDQRSAIIIVSGDSNAVMRVEGRLRTLSSTTHIRTYFTSDDDIIYLYGDSLGTISKDSIISLASGQGFDNISFFSYAKVVGGVHLWFRNEILIELEENVSFQDLLQLIQHYNVDIELDTLNEYSIKCENERDLISLSNLLYVSGLVKYSAPDYYGGVNINNIPPSDPKYLYQYYLSNTGQVVPNLVSSSEHGSAGVDIKATNAWNFVAQIQNNLGNGIKVSVIDDGVEEHEDLMSGTNSRVLQGWTCGGGDGSPMEKCFHGQCVAGIIAASHNNIGVAGIAPNTMIVPVRIRKDHQFQHWSWEGIYYDYCYSQGKIARAIRKSWKKYGAEILNNSWGGKIVHEKILRAFEKAADKGRDGKGCVITASAGNEGYTNNVNEIGLLSRSICVGAIDKNGQRAQYSNYKSGDQPGIDLVAFGGRYDSISPSDGGCDIRTIDREGNKGKASGNYYDYFGGTSAAAPMVSGVASLMLSVNPNLTASQVKNIIEQTAQKLSSYQFEPVSSVHPNGTWNEQVGYGLVDAHKAVVYAYMFGHDEISLSLSDFSSCNSFTCSCSIYHPELFTYEWACSSNLIMTEQSGTHAAFIPLSSGSGTITVNILSYGRVMYTKSMTVDLTTMLDSSLQPVSSTPLTITNNTLWSNNDQLLPTILTVDSLATLTVSGILFCTDNARIIVRPGGKLVVDGGTLTSACPGEMWQGIEVVGDRTKRQLAQYQGIVELRNGATIENAHCGIRTGLQGDASYATTGGIIRAEDAYFINNRRSVEFLSYTNHALNGSVTNNQSYFTGCSFTVNDDNLFSQGNGQFIDHVTLWEVRGIAFNGCTFENATTAQGDRRHAIYAEDAGFTVDKRCTDPVYNPSTCTCNAFVRSTFSGFAIAIEANTSGNQFPVKIDHSRFSENGTGVRINGNHFATVTRCVFDLTTNPQEWRYLYGLYLSGCSGFKVEANQFDGTVQYVDGITTGVYVNGSGSSVNSLYKNEFDNLSYGIHAYGNNSGLQIRCNEFDGSGADIFVPSGSSIASSQGSLQTSAGNKFMQAYGYNIFNGGAQTITYYYKNSTTNSNAEPVLNSSGVSVTPSNTANNCASTLCGITPLDPTPFLLAGFQSNMNAYTTAVTGNNDADGRDIAGGTGVETQYSASLQQGGTENLSETAQSLSETYYTAVRALMSDSLLNLGTLEQWHAAAQPIADPYSLTETRFMEGYAETFAADADDAELANYAEFHAMKVALRNNVADDGGSVGANNYSPLQPGGHVNWYALTPAQIAQLQAIAERNTGRASVMAKGVLCFFHGICYEDDLLVDDNGDNNAGTRAKRVTTDITDDAALTVYPNPTDDLLFMELRGVEIARVALYDLQGRMVTGSGPHAGAPQPGTTATMNLRNVPAGVYLLRVTGADGKEYWQKIVKR